MIKTDFMNSPTVNFVGGIFLIMWNVGYALYFDDIYEFADLYDD